MPDIAETPVPVPPSENQTVRERLDERLEWARKQVLTLCEAKAKAEFLGLLDAPARDIEKLVGYY